MSIISDTLSFAKKCDFLQKCTKRCFIKGHHFSSLSSCNGNNSSNNGTNVAKNGKLGTEDSDSGKRNKAENPSSTSPIPKEPYDIAQLKSYGKCTAEVIK